MTDWVFLQSFALLASVLDDNPASSLQWAVHVLLSPSDDIHKLLEFTKNC